MSARALALVVPLFATACASLQPEPSPHLGAADAALRACAEWFHGLEARVDAAGVRDARDARLPAFPYVRTSRLLASFRDQARRDETALHALIERLQALDLAAREHEIANLGSGEGIERARECGARLRAADLGDPSARARLLERLAVPDDYSTVQRALGLYALTRWPFMAGVREYQAEVRESFRRDLVPPSGGVVVRYGPLAAPALPRPKVEPAPNALGIPEPAPHALEALFAAHAPVFEIEVTGPYDRPGALFWPAQGSAPDVDAARPVVYRRTGWTRYANQTLLQLVYTVWFAQRPPESAGDLLAGRLDGVTWRVTLAPDGEPLVYDSMHPCGCYHLFFPTPRAAPRPAPSGVVEWMFAPQSLPRVADGERPVVRVATRTHYVERVRIERMSLADERYALRAYDELRSLPHPDGGRRSAFGPDGIIAGTERAERFLFWPMGITSAGAMRQAGRHATAFVGRRHFDDADLLEKRFTLDLR